MAKNTLHRASTKHWKTQAFEENCLFTEHKHKQVVNCSPNPNIEQKLFLSKSNKTYRRAKQAWRARPRNSNTLKNCAINSATHRTARRTKHIPANRTSNKTGRRQIRTQQRINKTEVRTNIEHKQRFPNVEHGSCHP